jgi:hypothetical protein
MGCGCILLIVEVVLIGLTINAFAQKAVGPGLILLSVTIGLGVLLYYKGEELDRY